MNERKTEDIVEAKLRAKGYYDFGSGLIVEKQKSDSPRIQHLLENASKKGIGVGRPEFIIHSTQDSEFLIVIECKADIQKHVSKTLNQYANYAVDGVLLYASFLSKQFDVLAIAVSGQTEAELQISHYLQLKGASKADEYTEAKEIISFKEYYDSFLQSDIKFKQDYDALLDYSRYLNNLLQFKKIQEAQRGFLISGILIALQNKAFKDSFKLHRTSKQLAKNLVETIDSEFGNAELPEDRRDNLMPVFSFIKSHPSLKDKDFFRFTPTSSGTYTISTDRGAGYDIDGAVFNSNGNVLVSDYTTNNANFNIYLTAYSTYYIYVEDYNDNTGYYILWCYK